MANPFAMSRWFHRIGHVTNTSPWRLLPTPKGLGVVTTIGRRTGKRRTRAMRVVRDGDTTFAVSLFGGRADWVRNVRKHPYVRIKFGRTTYEAVARQLRNSGERARAMDAYRPIAGWYDYVDYANFVWGLPTRRKLLRVHDEWFEAGLPVAFDLESTN